MIPENYEALADRLIKFFKETKVPKLNTRKE